MPAQDQLEARSHQMTDNLLDHLEEAKHEPMSSSFTNGKVAEHEEASICGVVSDRCSVKHLLEVL